MTTKWYDRANALLDEKGVSRVKVGLALGQTPQSASQKLAGKRPTSVDEVAVIAGLAGVSVAELVADDVEYITALDEMELIKLYRMLTQEQKDIILGTIRTFVGAAGVKE